MVNTATRVATVWKMLLNYCWTLSSNTKRCVTKKWKKSLCYLTFSGGLIQFYWISFLQNKLFKKLSDIYAKKQKQKKKTPNKQIQQYFLLKV